MKVFVSEYVCGGGWTERDVPPSLVREGRAMLQAIVQDLSRIPECRVCTTLDARHQPLAVSHVHVERVNCPREETEVFTRHALESDVCLIIAPELNNVLHERCELARSAGARRLLNPTSEVVQLCSDKLRLFESLSQQDIPTPQTVSWTENAALNVDWAPIVIKPRFGAGSQDVRLCASAASARRAVPPPVDRYRDPTTEWIAQPFVRGTPVSVGVLYHQEDGTREILPVAMQNLSDDGRFRYLGGQIPWDERRAAEVRDTVERACQVLPRLAGYMGFDLIVPFDDDEQPVLVEINPRLTTSYLGYRELSKDNLAGWLLQPSTPKRPIRWQSGSVVFLPDGSFERGSVRSAELPESIESLSGN